VHDHGVGRFLGAMHRKCRVLGMASTKFVNPHGLSHPAFTSTAR
jgi:D-alanyl-D-alanine carboxypeptidase